MDKAYQGFLNSHLIWKGDMFGMKQFELPRPSVDLNCLPVVPKTLRLGHQAEFVFLQLLNASAEYNVLAHSLQLIEGKRTVGELDYIIQNVETLEVLHIELAYKFYILDESISDPLGRIIGPNRKDNFIYKLNKTKEKQMPLLYSEASKIALKKLALDPREMRQMVAFYAHVFLPYNNRSFDINVLNQDCVVGYWINNVQFRSKIFKDYAYYFPLKSEWLHAPYYEVLWKSYTQICDEISSMVNENRSVMLWQLYTDESSGINRIERIFVCGNETSDTIK